MAVSWKHYRQVIAIASESRPACAEHSTLTEDAVDRRTLTVLS